MDSVVLLNAYGIERASNSVYKVRSQLESLHLSHMIVDHVVTKAEIRLKGTRNLSTFRRLIQKTPEQKLRKN